jgi:hypothetical protein
MSVTKTPTVICNGCSARFYGDLNSGLHRARMNARELGWTEEYSSTGEAINLCVSCTTDVER